MWQQNYEPVGGSLGLSAAVAAIPVLVLFFMLGVKRKPAWMAALTALAVAFVIALVAYHMPIKLAVTSTATGAAYGICLLANTAPVAFGSIGIPIVTLAGITGLPPMLLSAMVGRLCAMISVIIPAYLLIVMVGLGKTLEVLPAVIVCGFSFAGVQLYVSNYVGPELTDILSSLSCIACTALVLKLWKPKSIFRLE